MFSRRKRTMQMVCANPLWRVPLIDVLGPKTNPNHETREPARARFFFLVFWLRWRSVANGLPLALVVVGSLVGGSPRACPRSCCGPRCAANARRAQHTCRNLQVVITAYMPLCTQAHSSLMTASKNYNFEFDDARNYR